MAEVFITFETPDKALEYIRDLAENGCDEDLLTTDPNNTTLVFTKNRGLMLALRLMGVTTYKNPEGEVIANQGELCEEKTQVKTSVFAFRSFTISRFAAENNIPIAKIVRPGLKTYSSFELPTDEPAES